MSDYENKIEAYGLKEIYYRYRHCDKYLNEYFEPEEMEELKAAIEEWLKNPDIHEFCV
jgi:hypothetical protein